MSINYKARQTALLPGQGGGGPSKAGGEGLPREQVRPETQLEKPLSPGSTKSPSSHGEKQPPKVGAEESGAGGPASADLGTEWTLGRAYRAARFQTVLGEPLTC